MLRYVEVEEEWERGSGFEELMNECSDKVDFDDDEWKFSLYENDCYIRNEFI